MNKCMEHPNKQLLIKILFKTEPQFTPKSRVFPHLTYNFYTLKKIMVQKSVIHYFLLKYLKNC